MPFPFPLCWENTKRVLGGRVWKYSSSSTSVSSSNNRMMYLWFLEVWFNSSDLPDVINMINYPSLPFNFMKGKYVLCEWWKRLSREENIFFGEENIFSPCPVTASAAGSTLPYDQSPKQNSWNSSENPRACGTVSKSSGRVHTRTILKFKNFAKLFQWFSMDG